MIQVLMEVNIILLVIYSLMSEVERKEDAIND